VKSLVLLLGAAVSSVAWAQDRSDLMPAAPPEPSGPRIYVPGMPLPTQPSGERAPAVEGGSKGKGPGGVILPDDSSNFEVEAAEGAVNEAGVPETHVVQRGDTLWDLSARYYKNAYGWPKLWSYNPQITNPHWIYPGDLIRLQPPEGAVAAAPPPPPTPAGPRISAPPRRTGFTLRQTGFVEEHELAESGRIVGSKEEKEMLGTLDEAYVEFHTGKAPRVGERFTIYKPTQTVKHPLTGKRLGEMVEIFGEGEVRSVTDGGIARVAIVDAINPIWRGYLVGPLRRQFKVVPPRAGAADLAAVVVAVLRPQKLIGTDQVVFVDRGKRDGVELGNRFIVTRRGDGYQPVLKYGPVDDPRFPREDIAEVLIVDVGERVSTGLVTHAVKETEIGDRAEARRGY
jgi:hypothetical protein